MKSLVCFLVTLLALSPRMVSIVWAQDTEQDSASDEEVRIVQQLAKKGYLGEKKDFYLSAKALADNDITDGLLAINDSLSRVDLKSLQPGSSSYQLEDLKVLLKLVQDKSEDIRARKVSAWKFENRIKKMIAAVTPAGQAPSRAAVDQAKDKPGSDESESVKASSVQPTPVPQVPPTPTPIPGPNREEWDGMKDTIKDLGKKVGELQDTYDKKIETIQKTNEEIKTANVDIKTTNADIQEQLKLVKKILDHVQDDLKKTADHLDEVEKKAGEKTLTDAELQQELKIMHKDLRDNSQDVSVLKQQVAKLDKTDNLAGQSPLDQVLTSKYIAGGALLVGIAALVVALTKK